jgi:hypothetical protein
MYAFANFINVVQCLFPLMYDIINLEIPWKLELGWSFGVMLMQTTILASVPISSLLHGLIYWNLSS